MLDAPPRPTEEPSSAAHPHTDAQIRRLAHYDIDATCVGILGLPSLGVVPLGETWTRKDVFQELGIEEARLRDRRQWQESDIKFLRWQVSPSYDIVCVTATDDPANEGLDVFDPERMVYGIRLVMQGDGP
ncbi:MAG: hypothetical protein ACYTKD_05095 [Planctomycetota bacterium]